ncbi:hypothetical protein [Microbacterium sp. AK031]|uniref:hypothetical protein n=1 Tax=Microbacterium sp. AK031 TaxID=2723076 RepID=UPI00216807C4|nr:hypothetical protein [Microbacterium sp. AK031]MCS3844804.1 hypothetical protein [Microbacterium sp. AK031]
MTDLTPSATPFITRLITASAQADPLAIHAAVTDAEAAGVQPTVLIAAMAGVIEGLLADEGYTLGDLHTLLLKEAS